MCLERFETALTHEPRIGLQTTLETRELARLGVVQIHPDLAFRPHQTIRQTLQRRERILPLKPRLLRREYPHVDLF